MDLTLKSIVNEYTKAEDQLKQDPETQQLIEGCLRNMRASQEMLYKKYYGKMMGLCLRFANNKEDALEMLNTGFLKVFTHLDKYNYKASLGTWMYNIVRNTCIDHLRANVKFNNSVSLENHEVTDIYLETDPLQKMVAQDLLNLLHSLPPTTSLVFNLHAIEGYSHKEIAEQLNITEGTSKWHTSEARKLLKMRLENNDNQQ